MIDMTHEDIERIWDSVVHFIPEKQKLDAANPKPMIGLE